MKKIKVSIFLAALICGTLHAQNAVLPEPTTGSLASYINTVISPATGVPNIGVPLYQLESSSKEFPVGISLSYHVYNAKANVPASEVGQGWSLFTSGVITRQEAGTIDETMNWTDINEEYADTFYYTIPGHSGKFKIYRDNVNGNPIIDNMTGEKVKIEYVRDAASTKFIINSFKITDDNGFQYLFEEYNLGLKVIINYKTSFVLTKVKDPNGVEIVNYTYDKKIKYMGTSSTKKYQYCKINTISTAKGKLKFDYSYEEARDNEVLENDPYKLNSISLTDPADRLISRYQFIYGLTGVITENLQNNILTDVLNSRRALSTIRKLDKNLALYEENLFEYDDQGSSTQYGYYDDVYGNYICSQNQFANPKKYTLGLLKKITFPTKGSVVYDFEANSVYVDKSAPNYLVNNPSDPEITYYEGTQIDFDTNFSRNYPFQVTSTQPVYFRYFLEMDYEETDSHGNYIFFKYDVKNAANAVVNPSGTECSSFLYNISPGTYTATIPKGGGKGSFSIYQLKAMPAPYKNERPVKTGARIKSIRSFNADGTLVKTKKYEYSSFTQPLNATGEIFINENDLLSTSSYDGFVLYKNVKETEVAGTENNGYTKYYYKTPNDYLLSSTGYYPYYNFTSAGIMEKKEIYNSQDQLKESSEYEYSFQEIAGVPETNANGGTTKPSWLQYMKETAKSYLGQSVYQSVKESTFSPDNFQEILTKSTTADEDITEVSTKYAVHMGNTRLLNKNMISVPLQVETKANGAVISKATTKYDNINHLYPTSLETTDLAQVSETPITFDIYDDKGNLVQTSDKSGNSVTTIWGYHKTLPIAQITGAKYSTVAAIPAVAAAVAASDADADNPANEATLLTALENLRLDTALQPYPVSVSTYDPLTGITNSVSANGIKQSYEYDASGKLFRVKNADGQVIKENRYNYKH